MTANGSALHEGRPIIPITWQARVAQYRITISAVLLGTALAAAWTAVLWPIQGTHIQAPFFQSLAASSLTLLGLVFTLCLIGTQLIATRTNIPITRIFGPITWIYLLLFLIMTLWTLAISYYAGNLHAPSTMCRSFYIYRHCLSEVQAGRASIFGLAWSFLLLLPFVIYIYHRLSPRYTFYALVASALRARSKESFKQRCHRITEEIISVSPDIRAVTEGLSQLLELGAIGVQRKTAKGSLNPDDIAGVLTGRLVDLQHRLIQTSTICREILGTFQIWTIWLISETQGSRRTPVGLHYVSPHQVGQLTRIAVKSATRNLRLWQNLSATDSCARESAGLIQGIVEACETSPVPIRVRISEATTQLAECAVIKLVDGPRADFNLAFRSLIRLCELTSTQRMSRLGGKVALRETTRTLEKLAEVSGDRDQLSPWILDELHNLADKLSLEMSSLWPSGWKQYLGALALLKDNEVKEVLGGPGLAKSHELKGIVSHSWEAVVIGQLYSLGNLNGLMSSLASAVGRCANDADLPGLIALFEQIGMEYVDNAKLEIQPLLIDIADTVRSRFSKNHLIASSRRRSRNRP